MLAHSNQTVVSRPRWWFVEIYQIVGLILHFYCEENAISEGKSRKKITQNLLKNQKLDFSNKMFDLGGATNYSHSVFHIFCVKWLIIADFRMEVKTPCWSSNAVAISPNTRKRTKRELCDFEFFCKFHVIEQLWSWTSSDMLLWQAERYFWKNLSYLENEAIWGKTKLMGVFIRCLLAT